MRQDSFVRNSERAAFGLQVGAGHQWIHFLDVVGGNQEYKGAQIYGGLTYRFQY